MVDYACHSMESISMPNLNTISIWEAITVLWVFFFDFLFFRFPLLPLSNAVNNNIHSFISTRKIRRKKNFRTERREGRRSYKVLKKKESENESMRRMSERSKDVKRIW